MIDNKFSSGNHSVDPVDGAKSSGKDHGQLCVGLWHRFFLRGQKKWHHNNTE